MNQDLLEQAIEHWEPTGIEIVRTIDTQEMTVERIFKYFTHRAGETLYSLHRYVQFGIDSPEIGIRVECSIDLQDVEADQIIQHLAERL